MTIPVVVVLKWCLTLTVFDAYFIASMYSRFSSVVLFSVIAVCLSDNHSNYYYNYYQHD